MITRRAIAERLDHLGDALEGLVAERRARRPSLSDDRGRVPSEGDALEPAACRELNLHYPLAEYNHCTSSSLHITVELKSQNCH